MTETPLPLPSEGGSYTRDKRGGLTQTTPPTREEPETPSGKPDVKEG